MPFVIDASATLPWCFEDESTPWTETLLDRLSAGEQAFAPAHWPIEVSNGLLIALRRNRIQPGRTELFWDKLASLPIAVEPPLSLDQVKAVFALCTQHSLTFYDGTYLELAKRTAFPIATLDGALRRAAPLEGVSIVG
jgi:predicted nucleic acid-binding protein